MSLGRCGGWTFSEAGNVTRTLHGWTLSEGGNVARTLHGWTSRQGTTLPVVFTWIK